MLLWAAAGVPLGVYNIVQEFNIALRIQPQILTTLSLVTWGQCLYYGKKYPAPKCTAAVTTLLLVLGGLEAGLIFALKHALYQALKWPVTLMAVLSAVLLAAGVLTHYWDIYLHRTVRGISFYFVGIDAAGDLFSLVSVLFGPEIDVLGVVIYGTELALWLGVFVCGAVFNLLPWLRRRGKMVETRQNPVSLSLHPMPSSTSVFRTVSGSGSGAGAGAGAGVVERRGRTRAA
ncbi:hypothetical protein BO70DRAFT_336503 [Aspergillus heteromorphus CBS 117.55]|uniref:PQ loop repeat protein n=1 Tax=Aspergillus heteromorphus CBS 117.55 TaxID=1448321 RepID=A0A317W6C4_9EURO|nr:uncharacterized protein BO70DRAFT_336503 [Aspergillus heteromorphus CBS 117.55]PWY82166.1 hypothetical protein BO70DRAFT_336503 [Aspergillus heteromorphus CBS 117.55]